MHNFNPRSPRGGATHHTYRTSTIGIFQSTLPTRGSDSFSFAVGFISASISIHAPHEGERLNFTITYIIHNNFNPRSPRGGATIIFYNYFILNVRFQSTLPTRGSDSLRKNRSNASSNFNPRSPRGGATFFKRRFFLFLLDFNPRSPRGGATVTGAYPAVRAV